MHHRKYQGWYDTYPHRADVVEARLKIERQKARLHPVGPPPTLKWRPYFDRNSQQTYWHCASSSQSVWELPEDGEVEIGSEEEEEANPELPTVAEMQRWVGTDFYAQLDVGRNASMVEIKT